MSTTIRVYGASDDLVEIEGNHPIADEYGGPFKDDRFEAVISAESDGGSLILRADYTGVWTPSVALYGEDYDLPDWSIRYVHRMTGEPTYSAVLEMTLPDDARIELRS